MAAGSSEGIIGAEFHSNHSAHGSIAASVRCPIPLAPLHIKDVGAAGFATITEKDREHAARPQDRAVFRDRCTSLAPSFDGSHRGCHTVCYAG